MTDKERIEKIKTAHAYLFGCELTLSEIKAVSRFPSQDLTNAICDIDKAKRALERELDKLKKKK